MAKRKRAADKPHVEIIRWLDHCSFSNSGWKPIEVLRELQPVPMVSIGYVANETPEYVTLVASWGEKNGEVSGEICIIKRAILKRERVSVSLHWKEQ